MESKDIGKSIIGFIVAVIVFFLYIFGLGPLGVWMITNPLGIATSYMGRVSIIVGLQILSLLLGIQTW